MLPLVLDLTQRAVAIIGEGDSVLARLQMLHEAGAKDVHVYANEASPAIREIRNCVLINRLPDSDDFKKQKYILVYIADVNLDKLKQLREKAKKSGALVNVQDSKDLCDFHVPAQIRRGELLITISTNGRAPGLSRILKNYLAEHIFGPEWGSRVRELAGARDVWRFAGLEFKELAEKVDGFVAAKGWLTKRE